jgi:ABC-type uncharacterized transport system substrate-binding protein
MVVGIGRRDFVAGLSGVAASWPLTARAQQPMPVIGWLSGISSDAGQPILAAFRKALGDVGYVENRNVQFEYRWANGKYDQLPAMAADLVARPVTLIVTGAGEPAAFAAKAATPTIPIVMVVGSDPVKEGLVSSLNRPGGNITGATALFNPANPAVELQLRDVRDAAPRLGVDIVTFAANAESEFDGVFGAMAQRQAAAVLVGADPFFNSRRAHLMALAAQHRLPAIYEWRQFAVEGGLMSYGTVLTDAYAQAGTYAGRILNGEKPADLPVVQPTNFQFVINLKTAKSLGVEFSPTLSARADEVIE